MPVLESTDNITPRSVLRHRPIGDDGTQAGLYAKGKTAVTPVAQRASRPKLRPVDSHIEIDEWQRVTGEASTTLQTPAMPALQRTRTTTASRGLSKTPLPKVGTMKAIGKRQVHPLLYLGIGMLGMLVLWTILTGMISWVSTTMDDFRYGRPRTFQIDQIVGHNDSTANPSHFIALNLRGHIEIIEMPGGDAAHARIFLGPQLLTTNSDLVAVTLDFRDVNSDHKPDMLINVQASQFVFINDQGTFRPLHAEERHQVEQFLQHPVQ
jgi:hypothetical protein